MNHKGNFWNSACSETPFDSLKVRPLHGQRLKTRREAKDETINWLRWQRSSAL
ncbi:hypothetical protein [Variovorax paradoxus]|uniref:hypothetical protein n=1 Tax=Variovorax paradoxus TaxID=34073 RepID=UPI003F518B42